MCGRKVLLLNTFSVIAKAHLGLPEANGIFALAYTVELLQLGLVDTLKDA